MYNSDMPTCAELPSTQQLVRSTLIALVSAIVILVAVILPAEYAIDPTGAGKVLGLTDMGEIKQQLAQEAAADNAAKQPAVQGVADAMNSANPAAPKASAPTREDTVLLALKPGKLRKSSLRWKKAKQPALSGNLKGAL